MERQEVVSHEPPAAAAAEEEGSGSNDELLTPELRELVEESQVPMFPGSKITVHGYINELLDAKKTRDGKVTSQSVKEMISLSVPLLPRAAKIWEFIDRIDDLILANSLMRSLTLKSHGHSHGNAAASSSDSSSTKDLYATSGVCGEDMSIDSSRGGDPQWQLKIMSTFYVPPSTHVPRASGGDEIMRDVSIQEGDDDLELRLNSLQTCLFPDRSKLRFTDRTGMASAGKGSFGGSIAPK